MLLAVTHSSPGGCGAEDRTAPPARNEDALRRVASRRLDCAAWSLRIEDERDTRIVVSGCGRGALYEENGTHYKLLSHW